MRGNHHCILIFLFFIFFFTGVIFTPSLILPAFAETDEGAKTLSPEQKQLTERMLKFMEDMDKKYFDRVYKLNGNDTSETKEFLNEYSDYDIKVTRGPVIEKMGRMLAVGNKASPDSRMPGSLLWGRFYSLYAHPKSPLVGMLHAAIVVQVFDSGISFAG